MEEKRTTDSPQPSVYGSVCIQFLPSKVRPPVKVTVYALNPVQPNFRTRVLRIGYVIDSGIVSSITID